MSLARQKLGVITFWLTWPGIWLVLRFSHRTRAVITCGDMVLVVRPWLGNGKWNLPGGGIKKNERPIDTIIREIYEETKLSISVNDLTQTVTRTYKSGGLRFSYYEFRASLLKMPELSPPSRELTDIAWIKASSLNNGNANTDVLTGIKDKVIHNLL